MEMIFVNAGAGNPSKEFMNFLNELQGNHDKKEEPFKKAIEKATRKRKCTPGVKIESKNCLPVEKIKESVKTLSDVHFGILGDFPNQVNPFEARFIEETFNKYEGKGKNRKLVEKTRVIFKEPVMFDHNYPINGYFDERTHTTVLVFNDGSKVKAVPDTENRNKMETGIMIALAKRILGPHSDTDRNSLHAIYSKSTSAAQAEATFFGIVLSYFVTQGIVKDPSTFDLWMKRFVNECMEVVKPKVKKTKVEE